MNLVKKAFYDIVYSHLVYFGGAVNAFPERITFIDNHYSGACDEWRFSGSLGFGGKYRRNTNTVDYYAEDETPVREDIKNSLNEKLKEVYIMFCDKYGLELGLYE